MSDKGTPPITPPGSPREGKKRASGSYASLRARIRADTNAELTSPRKTTLSSWLRDVVNLGRADSTSGETSAPVARTTAGNTRNEPISKIIDGLYLGAQWNAADYDELSKLGITHIVNVTMGVPCFHQDRGTMKYLTLRVADEETVNILSVCNEASKFILDAIRKKGSVLVHCCRGISRSPTVIIAFLVEHYEWSMLEAFNCVQVKRQSIRPNRGFVRRLIEFESKLRAIPTFASPGCELEGYLLKEGRSHKTWKKRWFCMEDDCIIYYRNVKDFHVLGRILLRRGPWVHIYSVEEAPERKRPHCFKILTGERTWYLCANSAPEMQEWMARLRQKVSSKTISGTISIENLEAEDSKTPMTQVKSDLDNVLSSILTAAEGNQQEAFEICVRGMLRHFPGVPALQQQSFALSEAWELDFSAIHVGAKLAEGFFGEVHYGKLWGQEVAVKKLKRSRLSEKLLKEIRIEAVNMQNLRHPNIVLFMGACMRPPDLAIVTEFMSNGTLYDALRAKPSPDGAMHVNLMLDIAKGMAYLHSRSPQIIHRDLKPLNILVNSSGTAKISDFGLSKIKDQQHLLEERRLSHQVYGTLLYMAPEVVNPLDYDEVYDHKIDVFAFGMVLFEMMYMRDNPEDDFQRDYSKGFDLVRDPLYRNKPPPVQEHWPCVVNSMIVRCLHNDPNVRPTFTDIVSEIEEWDLHSEVFLSWERRFVDEKFLYSITEEGESDNDVDT